jgi:hypothetical protein
MKKIIVILYTFILSGACFAQYEYFNDLHPYDGTIEGANGIFSAVVTLENMYYAVGIKNNTETQNRDLYISKLNEEGELIENTIFLSSPLLYSVEANGIFYHADTEVFYVSATGRNDENIYTSFLIALDVDFNIVWMNEVLSENNDILSSLLNVEQINGDILAYGTKSYDLSPEAGGDSVNLILYNFSPSNDLIWEREYSYSIFGSEFGIRPYQVASISNENILCSGSIRNTLDSNNLLIKFNSEGDPLDWYEWGGEYKEVSPYIVVKNDSIAMVSYFYGIDYLNDWPYGITNVIYKVHLMEFNYQTMEPIWDIEYEPLFDSGVLEKNLQASDGGYYICGAAASTMNDVQIESIPLESTAVSFIMKTDSVGAFEWLKYYYFTHEEPDLLGEVNWLRDFEIGIDGGIIGVGRQFTLFMQNPWAIKLDACGDVENFGCPEISNVPIVDYEDAQNTMLEVYPNPTNSQVMLEYTKAGIHLGCQYKIYNQQGKLIIKDSFDGYELLDVSGWSVGLYIIHIRDQKGSLVNSSKLVVE